MINRNFYASTSKRKVEVTVVLSSCNILVSTTSPSPGPAKMVSTKSAPGVYNDTSQSKNLASKPEYFLVRFCIPHVYICSKGTPCNFLNTFQRAWLSSSSVSYPRRSLFGIHPAESGNYNFSSTRAINVSLFSQFTFIFHFFSVFLTGCCLVQFEGQNLKYVTFSLMFVFTSPRWPWIASSRRVWRPQWVPVCCKGEWRCCSNCFCPMTKKSGPRHSWGYAKLDLPVRFKCRGNAN